MPKGVELICPQCKGSFESRLLCPRCGVRLDPPEAPLRPVGDLSPAPPLPSRQPSPWSRLVVGLLLAQGIFYGLWQIGQSLLPALSADPTFWQALTPVLVKQGLQVFGILIGAMVAGAGQRWGFLYGCFLGVANGVLFFVGQYLAGQALSATEHAVELFGLPIIDATFGILGGFIGNQIWKPLPTLTTPTPALTPLPELRSQRKPPILSGPVAWGRVLMGVAIAVAGTVSANHIRDFVIEASGGVLTPETRLQADFITWEISVLAVMLGSAWAGATTPNGMKQGWVVGFIAAALLFVIYLYLGAKKPPEVTLGFVLAGIHLQGVSIHMQHFLFTITNVLALALVGGWFGGQLLPPLAPTRRRKDFSPLG